MSKVVVYMSMSVDGFIAGPHPAPKNPLGDHGLKLHDWFFAHRDKDHEFIKHLQNNTGAIIIGRRMYDESLPWWEGSGPMGDTPTFVLTNKGTEPKEAGPMFTFVTDGIESALKQAKKVVGDKLIGIGGGAKTIQEYLKAGLVDELNLHIVPILLGGGTHLFGEIGKYMELEKVNVVDDENVTHLRYQLNK